MTGKWTVEVDGVVVADGTNDVVDTGTNFILDADLSKTQGCITMPWPTDEEGVPATAVVLDLSNGNRISFLMDD